MGLMKTKIFVNHITIMYVSTNKKFINVSWVISTHLHMYIRVVRFPAKSTINENHKFLQNMSRIPKEINDSGSL